MRTNASRRLLLACTTAAALCGASAPAAAAKPGWTVQPTPNPAGAVYSYLSAVTCTSPKACLAVGYSSKMATLGVPVAERWNGTKWTIQHIPSVPGADHTHLYSISCTSPRACTAVGYSNTVSGAATVAETWNGKRWSIQHTPNPHGAQYSYLNSVSCASDS